jgi:hypothetical protein
VCGTSQGPLRTLLGTEWVGAARGHALVAVLVTVLVAVLVRVLVGSAGRQPTIA